VGTARAAPPANLLPNGSFEQEVNGIPVGWESRQWAGKATFELARQGHRSKRSVMIASDGGADFNVVTKVAVEPFATYRLSGWIKTEDVRSVSGRGALLHVRDMEVATSRALTGTSDWTRVEVVFNTCGQDRLEVCCCFGAWGQVTGKAWFDDLMLQQIGRYKLDYSHLFRKNSPNAPHIAYYGGQTAIAEHAFAGPQPQLDAGRQSVHWRLICGPNGMTVDADSGAPSWQHPIWGHHRVLIEAKNSAGRDIMEFILMVVKNDVPNGQVVVTKHMDFVLPPEGASWFEKWKPHAMLDAQFEYLRKLIGHEPARDGKQIVKFQPDMGGGAHSGNPAPVGPGFWSWDDVRGWDIGIWFHEVGHNFNAQAPIVFYSNIGGFAYHHHCHFLAGPVFMRTVADPAVFGLSGAAAGHYRRWTECYKQDLAGERKAYEDWLKNAGKARTYRGDGFHVWITICDQLASQYGVEILERSLRAMRTDGVPASLRETAKQPLQVNALLYCIMSHAASADLRPFFDRMGYEYDADYYETIDAKIGKIVKNLPDEDDLDGWKKNPHNGHYYRRTQVDSSWCAAEAEARQFGGHLATIRDPQELQWLQSRFETYPQVWIGGFQNEKRPGEWRWTSGERTKLTNWDKGQPASGSDPGFTLLLTGSGKWQVARSFPQPYPGIIEIDAKAHPHRHDR
jgi:hypothetical protein